ncbi:MAG: GNAT family N-acetyltransferase [Polyangiaceae bacterium]|nr:GNAT family N-acetyltransferase [Polyangiaceae bacterium]
MKVDDSYRETHALADGTRVTLRLLQPSDAEDLRRGFRALSPRSRYRRFLSEAAELTDEQVRYLTETDGVNHVAIVATTESLDLKSELGLGVARFVRLRDAPEVAEAAVTVVDEAQGRGIGRLLLALLARAARERGVRTLRAEVLAANPPVREILREVGAVVRSDDGVTLTADVPLAPEAGHDESPARRLLRAVAASLASLGR